MKLKFSDIPSHRQKIQEFQDNECWICGADFTDAYYSRKKRKKVPKHIPVLDHNHYTGEVRGVLCSGCNSVEGVFIKSVGRYHTNIDHHESIAVQELLYRLADYYEHYRVSHSGYVHPKHKTEDEKRVARNKKARMKRKAQ